MFTLYSKGIPWESPFFVLNLVNCKSNTNESWLQIPHYLIYNTAFWR